MFLWTDCKEINADLLYTLFGPVLWNSDLEWTCTCQERDWAEGFYLEIKDVWCMSPEEAGVSSVCWSLS